MDAEIDQQVKELLSRRKGEWQAVAVHSGVSYSWISKFMNERIANPGLGTLKKLHGYLCESPRVGAEGAPTPTPNTTAEALGEV